MKSFFVFISIISLIGCSFIANAAEIDFSKRTGEAYELITSLRFEKGLSDLEKIKKSDSDYEAAIYVKSYYYCLKAFIDEQDKDFNDFLTHRKKALEVLNDCKPNKFKRFCIADLYMQSAFLKIKREENISAAKDFNRAYRLLKENEKKYPDFKLNKRNLAILYSILGSVPSDYQWLLKLASFEGSVELGRKEASEFILAVIKDEELKYFRADALLILSYIDLSLSDSESNQKKLKKFFDSKLYTTLLAKNPLLMHTRLNLARKMHKANEGLSIYNKYQYTEGYHPYPVLRYMRGLLRLYKLDKYCYNDFQYFLHNYKGKSNRCSAYQKLAWIWLVHGESAKYHSYIKKIKAETVSIQDADKSAKKEAESGTVPNVYLMKARLLSDGGFFDLALKYLKMAKSQNGLKSKREQLEYEYRLARIYHLKGNKIKAIEQYKLTYKKGKSHKYYFAANSCIMLGEIYEQQGKDSEAYKYYKLCLELDFNEFKNSITQKAKAGIERTKKSR